jgi:hypothetical protein
MLSVRIGSNPLANDRAMRNIFGGDCSYPPLLRLNVQPKQRGAERLPYALAHKAKPHMQETSQSPFLLLQALQG